MNLTRGIALILLLFVATGVAGERTWRTSPSETPHRAAYSLTEAEKARGCFMAWAIPEDHLMEIRCPAAFSPYGVTWHRYCVADPPTYSGIWKEDKHGSRIHDCVERRTAMTKQEAYIKKLERQLAAARQKVNLQPLKSGEQLVSVRVVILRGLANQAKRMCELATMPEDQRPYHWRDEIGALKNGIVAGVAVLEPHLADK